MISSVYIYLEMIISHHLMKYILMFKRKMVVVMLCSILYHHRPKKNHPSLLHLNGVADEAFGVVEVVIEVFFQEMTELSSNVSIAVAPDIQMTHIGIYTVVLRSFRVTPSGRLIFCGAWRSPIL